MPSWLKTNKEEFTIDEQYDAVDIDTFSEMQELAYDLVKPHFNDTSLDKELLCMIINGVAGTGKSYSQGARGNFTYLLEGQINFAHWSYTQFSIFFSINTRSKKSLYYGRVHKCDKKNTLLYILPWLP